MSKNPIKKGALLKIYTDGVACDSPDPACAFLFVHNDEVIYEGCHYIGIATNNTAEYQAISTK